MSNTTDAVMAELIKFRISEDKDADVFEGRWNKIGFEPKVCNRDCGFMKDGRHIRCAAGGNKNTKGQGGTDKRLRYRIPPLLIEELLL